MIPAYPLQWPSGWKRTLVGQRAHGKFGTRSTTAGRSYPTLKDITINEAVERVRAELQRMDVRSDDLVISTNLVLRLDGFPRSDQRAPADPGVAVYWLDRKNPGTPPHCMAIDRYCKVADNLAAIAATLEAMRAVERHGGAEILERAYTNFVAIEPPPHAWVMTFELPPHASTEQVRETYMRMRSTSHPDRGGSAEAFDQVNCAWKAFCKERGLTP